MLTKNFIALCKAMCETANGNGGARYVINISNESINMGNGNVAKAGRLKSTMSFSPGLNEYALVVGENGTAANADDYKLLNALSDSYFEVL